MLEKLRVLKNGKKYEQGVGTLIEYEKDRRHSDGSAQPREEKKQKDTQLLREDELMMTCYVYVEVNHRFLTAMQAPDSTECELQAGIRVGL